MRACLGASTAPFQCAFAEPGVACAQVRVAAGGGGPGGGARDTITLVVCLGRGGADVPGACERARVALASLVAAAPGVGAVRCVLAGSARELAVSARSGKLLAFVDERATTG